MKSARDVIADCLRHEFGDTASLREADAILAALNKAGFTIERQVDVLRLLRQEEAVLGGASCHSPEHDMPETASNDERKV